MEAFDHRQRRNQYRKVSQYPRHGLGSRNLELITAMAGNLWIPQRLDRYAVQTCGQDIGNPP